MQEGYQYPKNELEFYARNYSITQLMDNYPFDELIAYYIFGLNTLIKLNEIENNDLFDEVGVTPFRLENDKHHFILRTFVIKTALEKLGSCQVELTINRLNVIHLN